MLKREANLKSINMNFKFQRADIAMADLTINYQREMVVDFTMPFLDLGKFTPMYFQMLLISL